MIGNGSAEKKQTWVRLRDAISANINNSLRHGKHGMCWERLVGYTLNDLTKHLEKKFSKGMTWENYGTYWHIDHIIPVSAYNYSSYLDIDFRECWSLKNLRPLLANENISKGGRLDRPFQPSLKIACGRG